MGIFGRPGCETYYGIFSSGGIGVNSVSGYLWVDFRLKLLPLLFFFWTGGEKLKKYYISYHLFIFLLNGSISTNQGLIITDKLLQEG